MIPPLDPPTQIQKSLKQTVGASCTNSMLAQAAHHHLRHTTAVPTSQHEKVTELQQEGRAAGWLKLFNRR